MPVKSIAECSATLSTFIKLPFVIKTFVLTNFEWPLYTGFTVKLFLSYLSFLIDSVFLNFSSHDSLSSAMSFSDIWSLSTASSPPSTVTELFLDRGWIFDTPSNPIKWKNMSNQGKMFSWVWKPTDLLNLRQIRNPSGSKRECLFTMIFCCFFVMFFFFFFMGGGGDFFLEKH